MKELVVISGKGGTGKTSLVACFSALATSKILADCDVDAADLHLILQPEIKIKTEFYSGKKATVDYSKCYKCYRCKSLCKFDAISDSIEINEMNCEGCGVCEYFCPVKAITLNPHCSGEWYISETRSGKLLHAQLGIAEENSGKLVTTLKNEARKIAKEDNAELIIIDGSPGIGCPVIASISGASLVLIVTEPSLSGIHDAKRVYELTQHFKIPACMCINKFDINTELTGELEDFCAVNSIEIVGKIPYTDEFTKAQFEHLSIVEYSDNHISKQIKTIWEKTYFKLLEKQNA